MHSNTLTCLGKSNKKKERVTDGPTIKYSQGIQNSCIISSLASALYYMGEELASVIFLTACIFWSLIHQSACPSLHVMNGLRTKRIPNRPWMGWFRYAGRVEILSTRRPFITCKEGQAYWWIKLPKMHAVKNITEKASSSLGLETNKENISFILILWFPTKKSQISLFRISKVTQTRFMTWQVKWRNHLKNRDWKLVSIHKYTKSHASLTVMVKLNTLEGHLKNNEVALEQFWICEKFEFSEPDIARCDETRDITYNVPVRRYYLNNSQ